MSAQGQPGDGNRPARLAWSASGPQGPPAAWVVVVFVAVLVGAAILAAALGPFHGWAALVAGVLGAAVAYAVFYAFVVAIGGVRASATSRRTLREHRASGGSKDSRG
jgi:protein-S-isoprenylcysteine O-methyltransferase Ste14